MSNTSFSKVFQVLTGTSPFPWQQSLYESFIRGEIPSAADLPTGLGKTSVVAIWLIALITHPDRMPRRLVYTVNRRTVVDQTTAEVERLRERLHESPDLLAELKKRCAMSFDSPLALSTLRGQFADNREWCADPARPAVIVGTVDMIGSGLLFSRYSCGFKTRPHHAALLGQDALLIHDEAHLEPAFQKLLNDIVAEQKRCKDARPLRVLELSATTRGTNSSFSLTPEDEKDSRVHRRLHAAKRLNLHPIADEKQLAENLATLALARRDSGRAVLIFARFVEVVQRVTEALDKQKLATVVLTGTMRGKERDDLAQKNPKFLRFLPPSSRSENSPPPAKGTVYLIATSAGEVGVNISADDLICDLSTYESMAQRFGRVNRFGDTHDTTIELIHPESFNTDDPLDAARARTLELLRLLAGDACPDAFRKLDPTARSVAFSPAPEMLPAADVPVPEILFDAWALTSIRDTLPGRPPVAPYLHGISEWQPPETRIAWREEVDIIKGELLQRYIPKDLEDLLDDYPLKTHELLRDSTDRKGSGVFAQLEKLSVNFPDAPVWILDARDQVLPTTLKDLISRGPEQLYDATVILSPSVGGLSSTGTLEGKAKPGESIQHDVADEWFVDKGQTQKRRVRVWDNDPEFEEKTKGMRLVRTPLDTDPAAEESENDETPARRYWYWFSRPRSADDDLSKTGTMAVKWQDHTDEVMEKTRQIVQALNLPGELQDALVIAAKFHDLGKKRTVWQRSIGNPNPADWHAKSGRNWKPFDICPDYRHEFGSLIDVERIEECKVVLSKLGSDERDLVLHLIAAHHGRARPHFPLEETFDPSGKPVDSEAIATEVPRRFARLQRQFGRWGLAYLESLLRAADYAASAGISLAKKTAL
jgi:CRISPR-associated endonuclease/helicase Cas3